MREGSGGEREIVSTPLAVLEWTGGSAANISFDAWDVPYTLIPVLYQLCPEWIGKAAKFTAVTICIGDIFNSLSNFLPQKTKEVKIGSVFQLRIFN